MTDDSPPAPDTSAHPATPGTSVMAGGGWYNDHSAPQHVAGDYGLPLLTRAAESVPLLAVSRPELQRVAAASPLLAAAGLAGLALDADALAAALWVVLLGAGFALPYALMIERAQRLFPDSPAAGIALLQTGPNVVPMVVVPLVGAALDSGHGSAAFLALAVFVALVALVNAGRPH